MVNFLCLMETDFSTWLLGELRLRDWSQADLASRSGLSQGAISKVVNKQRKPGFDFCEGVSKALKVPVETIYAAAGLLPPSRKTTSQEEELLHLFRQLPEKEKSDLIKYVRINLTMLEQSGEFSQKKK